MAAITKGVDPRKYFCVSLLGGDRDNCSQNLTHMACHVEVIDGSSGEAANCDTEVCNRFGHIFCEVTGDPATGRLTVAAVFSARVDDDLDVDLLAEPQGVVVGHRQCSLRRCSMDQLDKVLCADGRVWRCWWLTRHRCTVEADD